MKQVLVIGAGRIGITVADLLAGSGAYAVTLADRRPPSRDIAGVRVLALDAGDEAALAAACAGQSAVIGTAPFYLNAGIAGAAKAAGAHYLDVTEDVATTGIVRRLAADAATAFVPQCGLAPGFVGIVAADLARRFDRAQALRLRVGALPRFPLDRLKYNLTWSTDGLINEYCNPCLALRDGRPVELAPLEGLERLSLDGIEYEAFNTSGGLGTLAESLAGKVDTLDYKTIRYPGHADALKLLLEDLGLARRRDLLKEIFESSLPETAQDVVLVLVSATGDRRGHLTQETFTRAILGGSGPDDTAIQRTTAAGVCVALDLLLQGRLRQRGFVRQEDIALADFLANRFAGPFAETAGGDERRRRRA
jgi:saccharopine dehydrogenase-like NADP-dependent oxidoreductase